jgi:hypothetical protein
MSRFLPLVRRGVRFELIGAAAVLVLAGLPLAVPTAAQDLPPCGDDVVVECRLSDWTSAGDGGDVESPFGAIDGVVWVEDEQGDAPEAGLDILAVGLGSLQVTDPGPIRRADDLIKLGGRKKAVDAVRHVVVRVVLDRPISDISDGHAGIHVATDVDGSRSNNAPAGVGTGYNPFAATQDVYSLTYATSTGKSRLLKSDLAKGWYKAKGPYAAMWAAPNVLDMIVTPQEFGDDFRAVTFVSGPDGGYDVVDVAGTPIASGGRIGFVASCVEASIETQPFTVRRLVENGQTLRDVEAPASWRGGGAFPLQAAERDALATLIAATDDDGDGAISLPSTVSLFEDGVVIRQRPEIVLRVDGGSAQLSMELGLTRRGYNVIRDIELQPTGDDVADEWLVRATDALTEALPPFRLGKQAGLIAGGSIGECVTDLAQPAQPPDELAPDDAAASA